MIRFWIKEFDIDGIRLDCADCLDFSFMQDMKRVTGELKEDFWLMGEVIHGDYARYIREAKIDSEPIMNFIKGFIPDTMTIIILRLQHHPQRI